MRLLRGLCLLACLSVAALHAQIFNATFPAQPTSIAAGQDGNLYVVLPSDTFGVLTPAGTYTQIATLSGAPTLCLQMPNGNFLGFLGSEVITVSTAGQVSTLGTIPVSNSVLYICPIAASDGNYYGGYSSGGSYNKGFLYQVTPASVFTTIYNFTGTTDGLGPQYPLIQASDGNFYGFSIGEFFRYNTSSGVVVLNNSITDSESLPDNMLEGSDGNIYTQGFESEGEAVLAQFTTSGEFTAVATGGPGETYTMGGSGNIFGIGYQEAAEDYCTSFPIVLGYSITGEEIDSGNPVGPEDGFESGSFIPNGAGGYYGMVTDTPAYFDNEYEECVSSAPIYSVTTAYGDSTRNIKVSLDQTHVLPGKSSTLSWAVNAAYSLDRQQCYAYGPSWAGKQALSGTLTVTPSAAGISTYALQCGGTLTGVANLVAGNAALTLLSSVTTIAPGLPITLQGIITNGGTPAPTGNISFYDGTLLLGSAPIKSSNGAALQTTASGVSPGTYNITAHYTGDSNYGPVVSAPVAIKVVAPGKTTLALSTTTPTVEQGSTASFTVVATSGANQHDATGAVKFYYGTQEIGSATFTSFGTNTSTATFKPVITGIPAGTYSIVAKYAGDGWNGAATSNPVSIRVTPDAVSLSASPNPVPANTAFTLTAKVQSSGAAPTGSVLFYAGTTQIGSASLVNGSAVATFQSGTLAAGTYSVTAYYAGDKNNPAVTSPAVSLTVD